MIDWLLVDIVDCRSQCNTSASSSTQTTSQRPPAVSSTSSASTGFIQIDRSPSGRCSHQKSCAATLRAAPGQRINVTLWDFTMPDDRRAVATGHKTHGVETCYRCV